MFLEHGSGKACANLVDFTLDLCCTKSVIDGEGVHRNRCPFLLSRVQLMTPDKRMNPCRGVVPRQRIRKISSRYIDGEGVRLLVGRRGLGCDAGCDLV